MLHGVRRYTAREKTRRLALLPPRLLRDRIAVDSGRCGGGNEKRRSSKIRSVAADGGAPEFPSNGWMAARRRGGLVTRELRAPVGGAACLVFCAYLFPCSKAGHRPRLGVGLRTLGRRVPDALYHPRPTSGIFDAIVICKCSPTTAAATPCKTPRRPRRTRLRAPQAAPSRRLWHARGHAVRDGGDPFQKSICPPRCRRVARPARGSSSGPSPRASRRVRDGAGRGAAADTDPLLTMRPPPCVVMSLNASRATWNAASRFVPTTSASPKGSSPPPTSAARSRRHY